MCVDIFRKMNKVTVLFYPHTKANSTLIITVRVGKRKREKGSNEVMQMRINTNPK